MSANFGDLQRTIHPKSPYRMNADDLPWTLIDKLWIRHRRFEPYRPSHRLQREHQAATAVASMPGPGEVRMSVC